MLKLRKGHQRHQQVQYFWGAVIAAGASLLKGQLDKNAASTNIGRQHDVAMQDRQFAQDERFIEYRVEDAKRAGIHPLFALGGGAGGGYSIGGSQAPSGSHIGTGIETAGREIARGIRGSEAKKRQAANDTVQGALMAAQIRNLNARSSLTETENMAANSAMKTAEQDVWSTGVGRGDSLGLSGDQARTFPVDTKRGRELQARPLTQTSRASNPLVQELVGPDGYRYSILTDDAGDEIKQLHLAWKLMERGAKKIWVGRKLQEKLHAYKRRTFKTKRSKRTLGGFRGRANTWRNR